MVYRNPEPDSPDYDADARWKSTDMNDRNLAWLQIQLPMADFDTWTTEEIEAFKQITAHHCCSVWGRWDDEGCTEGC